MTNYEIVSEGAETYYLKDGEPVSKEEVMAAFKAGINAPFRPYTTKFHSNGEMWNLSVVQTRDGDILPLSKQKAFETHGRTYPILEKSSFRQQIINGDFDDVLDRRKKKRVLKKLRMDDTLKVILRDKAVPNDTHNPCTRESTQFYPTFGSAQLCVALESSVQHII